MSNTILTINMITREAVRLFKNSNLFVQNIDKQYDGSFAIDGAKIGSSLRIRLPSDYTVRQGPAMSLQDTTEQFTTLNVTTQSGVDVPFTTAERTMSLDDYAERVMAPLINNLAGNVAATIMLGSEGGVCNFVNNVDGAGNTTTPASTQFLLGNAILDDQGASQMGRCIVNDPTTDALTTVSLQGLLNPVTEVTAQFRSGMMKSGLGYEKWFRDQTVIKHTTGTFSAGGTVNGSQSTPTSGGNLLVNAITGTFSKGDIVTIDNVNTVNRVTKQSLQTLRQFVVTAAVVTTSTLIPLYPGIVGPPVGAVAGTTVQYQTVDNLPVNGAQVRLVNKASEVYRKSIAFIKKAVTMATADLVLPRKAVEEAARAVYDGISMRILTDYLPNSDQLATRVDVLYGFLYIRPEWLTIIAGKV
jgi:P22 coat protein - gene protein 5